jgi:hypothetical protein
MSCFGLNLLFLLIHGGILKILEVHDNLYIMLTHVDIIALDLEACTKRDREDLIYTE